MRRVHSIGAVGLGLLLGQVARADGALLHEYVPDIDPAEVTAALIPASERARRDAVEASSESGASSNADGSQSSPSENFRPDRLTSLEGSLDYYEVFDPSIAPFKRVMSLDATHLDVDAKTPVLGIHATRRSSVPIEAPDAAPPDARARDRFTAELDLDFRSDPVQRLASVSPESRILGLVTTPKTAVQIERDGADNYFIRALAERPAIPVHVTFLTDAPRAYFGAQIPRVSLRALPSELPPLHPSIRRRALHFAAQLGITPKSDLRSALDALTQHFRAFVESASPPEDTGDLYLDLVRGSKGLCRHRAYGFVVTAHALGIPARFVQNEAHSWVEVKLPGSGFLRIDLGGAAHGLTAHSMHERPSYLPAQPDTLPRPESYRESYARAEVPKPSVPASDSNSLAGRWLHERTTAREPGRDDRQSAIGVTERVTSAASAGGKTALRVSLSDRRMSAVRGGKLVLTGRVLGAAEQGVAELRVEVWIARDKQHERMLLGVSVTDSDGYFRTAFGVPPDLDVGDYRLVIVSQGDDTHLPVVTE
jgi:hypothetical protein